MHSLLLSDLALARRLERAEAHANAMFVATRAKLFPESGARWIEVAGAYAMYDGVSSPLTQTFGLGLFDPVTPADMGRLENFFEERGAPVCHEVSPLADKSLLPLLNQRQYGPIEFTSVMRLALQGWNVSARADEGITVRVVREEHELWAQTASKGWSDVGDVSDLMLEVARISALEPDAVLFLAEKDGRAIAAGRLSMHDGVALLSGASTIPEARKQGAQRALLHSRLHHAREAGCDLAMMGAEPGSASQRNAERQGFRIAYTRIKWRLLR